MLFLMLSVFAISLSSSKMINSDFEPKEEGSFDPCQYYAEGHWQEAVNNGYSNEEAAQVFAMQYDYCVLVLMR